MGDIADQIIQEGFDELARHKSGECGEDWYCRYCEEEYEKEKEVSERIQHES